jgi:tetratricopeptide (TPR) repeat protein
MRLYSTNKILAIDPSYVDALNDKTLVLYDIKRYDDAIAYLDKILIMNPKDN